MEGLGSGFVGTGYVVFMAPPVERSVCACRIDKLNGAIDRIEAAKVRRRHIRV